MNLPNKLTLARCVMAPAFLAVLLIEFPFHYAVALLLFIAASLTDLLDGKIARSRGLVTNLGKFLDPLADKALTTFAYLGLMTYAYQGRWETVSYCCALALILAREFAVTSARYMAAKDGLVIAASMAGKVKTVMQMVSIMWMLAALQAGQLFFSVPAVGLWATVIGHGLLWVATVLTVTSGIEYVWGCRRYFTEK